MNELGELLRKLRGKRSLRNVAKLTDLSHTYISDLEKGFSHNTKAPINPSPDTLKRLAKAYEYPYEELLTKAGYIDEENENDQAKLNTKDELDIAKRMEQLRKDLEKGDGLSFSGEPMSEEAKESLLEAMEYAVRQTQRINKKYIPKKYRDDN
ncbi:helix-turn-helix domain-containing protein [Alkalihalobacillus sp. BA299]|uniref:helix-turn-helix domain-containing protein n=1 Tax=Alkalihalobacillus sp. BA299 TaxID=2815938 RepID=UPI001ADB4D67|nr:helix-turn-helix transcriptional regulator [Alkalihalobacillus sp. BA299]